jgi:hypothetical protein
MDVLSFDGMAYFLRLQILIQNVGPGRDSFPHPSQFTSQVLQSIHQITMNFFRRSNKSTEAKSEATESQVADASVDPSLIMFHGFDEKRYGWEQGFVKPRPSKQATKTLTDLYNCLSDMAYPGLGISYYTRTHYGASKICSQLGSKPLSKLDADVKAEIRKDFKEASSHAFCQIWALEPSWIQDPKIQGFAEEYFGVGDVVRQSCNHFL